MHPIRISFGSLPIRFRRPFGHTAATRARAENIIVLAEDALGRFGLGEGCPRAYVTGETAATAGAFLAGIRPEIAGSVHGPEGLEDWSREHAPECDNNPSAFCALELALLDLFARQRMQSLETLLGLPDLSPAITASAVYGLGGTSKFLGQAAFCAGTGMRDAKLKLSGNRWRDGARAALLSLFGQVRLDANNLWPGWAEAKQGLSQARHFAWAVEEPVRPRDWAGMVRLQQETGLAIIADESVTRMADLDAMPDGFAANLRVSKMGGLRRTLRAIAHAKQRGIKVVIGAHVGESSILARAGLVCAAAAGDALCGFEGGYGTWLLERDTVAPSLTFERGGKIPLRNEGRDRTGAGLQPTPELRRVLSMPLGREDLY